MLILAPDYYQSFHCIGGDCEDSCCTGWQVISIDKASYKKYKSIQNQNFKEKLLKNIIPNRQRQGGGDLYKVKMETGRCPFLNKENLCDVYINCGEKALSTTCTTYPRTESLRFGQMEYSLSLSCPEVGRLALLHKDPIEFIPITEMESKEHSLNIKNKEEFSIELKIRQLCFDTIQIRDMSLEARLFAIGYFLVKLDSNISKEESTSDFENIFNEYQDRINNPKSWQVLFNQCPTAIRAKLNFFLTVLTSSFGSNSVRMEECLKWFMQGIGEKNESDFFVDIDILIPKFNQAVKTYYYPFLEDNSYILENYLISTMFYHNFPFEKEGCFFDSYIKLICNFTTIKIISIGMALFHKRVDIDHVLQFIQVYEKATSHSADYIEKLTKIIHKEKFDSLGHMAALLKDEV